MSGWVDGLATVGRWQTFLGSGLAAAVILLFVGILLAVAWGQRGNRRTGRVTGTGGTDATCTSMGAPTCDGTVTYVVGGRQYSARLQYPQGTSRDVALWYDPANPADVQTAGLSTRLLVGVALLLLLLLASVAANAAVVAKSRTYAAFTGAGDMAGLLGEL